MRVSAERFSVACLLYASVSGRSLEGDVMLFSDAGALMMITFVKQEFSIKVWSVNIIGNISVHIGMYSVTKEMLRC